MAKEFVVDGNSGTKTTTNKRYAVTYTLNGKKVTTVGMLHKDEAAAFAYVKRELSNLGIQLPAGTKMTVDSAATR